MHICKTETVGDVGNGVDELVRELDVLVARELYLPETAVGDALFQDRIGEVVLAIESGWPFLRCG